MKRVLALLFLLLPFIGNAQSYSSGSKEHFTFKGISITGTVDSFAKQMVTKGFTLKDKNERAALFSGKFANETDTQVLAMGTEKSNTVYMVIVQFSKQTTWSSLKGQYMDFKESLTVKYGAPTTCTEEFYDPYYEGDNYEMQAVSREKCKYTSFFESQHGNVMLTISDDKCVTLLYVDNDGHAIHLAEERSAVLDDL